MGGRLAAEMFGSLVRSLENVATVVLAPVGLAAVLVEAVTKPLAEGAQALTDAAKDATGQKRD